MHNGIGWARKVNQLPIAEMRSIDDENVWPLVIPILFIQPVIKMQGQFVNIRKDVNSTIIFRQPPARFCENVISIVFVKGFKDWPTIHLMPHFSPNFVVWRIPLGQRHETAKIVEINPEKISERVKLFNGADTLSWIIAKIVHPRDKLVPTKHQIPELIRLFLVAQII